MSRRMGASVGVNMDSGKLPDMAKRAPGGAYEARAAVSRGNEADRVP